MSAGKPRGGHCHMQGLGSPTVVTQASRCSGLSTARALRMMPLLLLLLPLRRHVFWLARKHGFRSRLRPYTACCSSARLGPELLAKTVACRKLPENDWLGLIISPVLSGRVMLVVC